MFLMLIIIGWHGMSITYYNSHDKQKICLKKQIERIKRNLSQEQLAELANLNRNTIGKIEREEVSPTIETLKK